MVEEDKEEKHRRALEHRTSWTELSISNQLLICHAENRHERYVHHVCNCGCWIHCENVFVLFLFSECSPTHLATLSLAKLTTNLSCRHPKPARQNIVHQNMMILIIFLGGFRSYKKSDGSHGYCYWQHVKVLTNYCGGCQVCFRIWQSEIGLVNVYMIPTCYLILVQILKVYFIL